MLVDTFANRLKQAMEMSGLKQIDLAKKTKLDKSLISNYISGNYNAKQDKLSILAKALNVSETWLMGYDVDINNNNTNNTNNTGYESNNNFDNLDYLDQTLFSKAKMLNDDEKKTIISVIDAIHKDIDKELDK